MKLINRENGEELVEVGSHKDYASKGVAGAGLGLGVAEHADFNLFRRTCRMITGELVLPNTPTVTGYPSYNPCRVDNSTSTPAA